MSKVIMYIEKKALGLVLPLHRAVIGFTERRELDNYLKSERRPWRQGYALYRNNYLRDVIYDSSALEMFQKLKPLPAGYGFRLDARLVEIPWVLGRLEKKSSRLLDAGSSLNSDFVLRSPTLVNKKITIATLAPEAECHWRLGVSYAFGDLRNLNFRNDWFDVIACISTIEHVGMDNTMYTGAVETAEQRNPKDFALAIKEFKRVLKPGGVLYITFPFGEYEDHGWFQQFDSLLTDRLIQEFVPSNFSETVFRYDPDGWKLSDRASCARCQFFDVHKSKYFDPDSTLDYPPDYPAGERSVVCLEMVK